MLDCGMTGRRIAAACGVLARRALLCMMALGSLTLIDAGRVVFAACPERPACRGCGCKGGPGYRGPDGRCVGFKALDKVCGIPPETHCTFENAPAPAKTAIARLAGTTRRKRPNIFHTHREIRRHPSKCTCQGRDPILKGAPCLQREWRSPHLGV